MRLDDCIYWGLGLCSKGEKHAKSGKSCGTCDSYIIKHIRTNEVDTPHLHPELHQ